MKKSITNALKIMAALLLVVVMGSCGSKKPTAEDVNAKIQAGQELTQDDYTTLLDYVGDYASKAQEYYNIINAAPNDSTPEYVKAFNDLAELYGKYPYLQTFRSCLQNVDASKFDDKNLELVNKYANDEGFPLPVGEGSTLLNPQVQGDIVDMPQTDSTNVIATGDGEAVDMKVE